MEGDKEQLLSARYLPGIKRVVLRILAIFAAAIFLSPFLFIIYIFGGILLFSCDSAPLKIWTNIGGFDFAYVRVACDTLAGGTTDELQVGVHRWHWKEAIFVVVPEDYNLLPSIAVENGAIVVDLSKVDEIILAKNEWRGHPISYRIGSDKYPRSDPDLR
jgi:hypothetical protein